MQPASNQLTISVIEYQLLLALQTQRGSVCSQAIPATICPIALTVQQLKVDEAFRSSLHLSCLEPQELVTQIPLTAESANSRAVW